MKNDTKDMERMNLSDGALLQGGKYRIVRFIGSGGFGNTYEAEHTMLHSRVAVKEFFVKDFCNRDETTEQVTVGTNTKKGLVDKLKEKFVEEARAISQLHHPNIVGVTDVFEENGTAYYVMDYIDGLSLDEIVTHNGPLLEKEAILYIKQIANALACVHSQNRLHLDVKPGNIISDGNGNVFLIDFGASKQYDEVDGENTSTLMGRTPGYAPIEQIGNDVAKFTPATDIYALGATLYKLVTGVTPIGANMLASGEKLAPLPENVSRNVANAIYVAMRTNRRERPQSIAEFLSILNTSNEGVTELGYNNNSKDVTVLDLVGKDSTQISSSRISGKSKVKDKSTKGTKSKSRKNKIITFVIIAGVLVIATLCIISLTSRAKPEYAVPITEIQPTGQIDGYDYVDLGLSVMWATCNIGASNQSGYGKYFAWGETKSKLIYTKKNSVTYERSIENIAGNSQLDVARTKWGGSWRMPTDDEISELVKHCTYEWAKLDGHYGYKITGPNGNSIFLPAAGWRGFLSYRQRGEEGEYWSTTPTSGSTFYYSSNSCSNGLWFNVNDNRLISSMWLNRHQGLSVRPVSESNINTPTQPYISSNADQYNGHEYVDLGLSVKWATCNLGALSPSDYGCYYAWGETRPKASYTETNSYAHNNNLGDIAGNPLYDAARANWGCPWRLPTKEEWDELIRKCKWEWDKENHWNKVTGPNGNSIIFPAAGIRCGTTSERVGKSGGYWGSTPANDGGGKYMSYGVSKDEKKEIRKKWSFYGLSVRPVSE